MGAAMSFLAGTDQDDKPDGQGKETDTEPKDSQRETILEMIMSFCKTMNDQELGTMYLMLSEIEKDRGNLQRILQFITQTQPTNNPT
jgi:hypothetical protein